MTVMRMHDKDVWAGSIIYGYPCDDACVVIYGGTCGANK